MYIVEGFRPIEIELWSFHATGHCCLANGTVEILREALNECFLVNEDDLDKYSRSEL